MRESKMPVVSVIISTKNEEKNIGSCLDSVKSQTYNNIEIIVVDNKSTDRTKEIANKYTKNVYDKGPERSVQRNFGVKKAKGEYVLILDADMILTKKVVEECVGKFKHQISNIKHPTLGGIIIPEESFGEGFWAQCKRLERSFYVGVEWMEAARFYSKKAFEEVGGFDEDMISGEDWDLSQRIGKKYLINNIESYIYHNEGRLTLGQTLKKKLYYAQNISIYQHKEYNDQNSARQTNILERYKLFFSKPTRLFSNPIIGIGMIFMKTCELGFGGLISLFKVIR